MEKVVIKRYSTAFKQQIVAEYENGARIATLQEQYGIGGYSTVANWVKQYGRKGLRHQLMVIQKPEEQSEVKALKAKIAQLEKVVAELTLDKFMLETTLEVVEAELGKDPKKDGGRRSSSVPTDKAGDKGRS
jgi:transposase-like protein